MLDAKKKKEVTIISLNYLKMKLSNIFVPIAEIKNQRLNLTETKLQRILSRSRRKQTINYKIVKFLLKLFRLSEGIRNQF